MKLSIFGEIEGERIPVGVLETVPGREEQFTYDQTFIERFPDSPLSVQLPLQPEPYSARQSRPFFRNLLPEGAALAAVAKTLEVKSSSYLKVLEALGNECIGAVIVEGEACDEEPPYDYLPISRETLGATMAEGAEGIALLQEEAKLSLAGAQSKMGLYWEPGSSARYFVPQGTAASTHIVKAPNRRFDQLSENEHYCLLLAAKAGMRVANSSIDVIDGRPVYVTERFDRAISDKTDELPSGTFRHVFRCHQEDFCQITGKLPEHKYEQPGQNYARDVFMILRGRSTDPLADTDQFVRSLIVNAILGNCDGHLKNYTALRGTSWDRFSLAPAYDIASTVVYRGLDRHMAMHIGSTNKIDEVSRNDFMELARDLSVSERAMGRLIDECREGIADAKDSLVSELEDTLGRSLDKLREISLYAQGQIARLGS